MSRQNVIQLFYGTALLTAIMVAPLVTLQLHLDRNELPTAYFRYPGVLSTAVMSLVLTCMAMAPYLVTPTHLETKHKKKYFLAMLPWILVCWFKFAINVKLQLKAIFHVANGNEPQGLVFALVAYCAIFGLALEQMLHWGVIYHLMTEGVLTSVTNFCLPRRAS
ncbi:uncharacterized protein LOC108041843 [Drosophila rhopaloa]|uniref:Uncharacterized protein LOC108041843 n=1 Tax=Drosophila rhopaloa TaxID=1041015 RepID=A0A6P4EFS3_DRORH|nr:uncharacterized protein LOC108041843 [Drosophila rhopaloa]